MITHTGENLHKCAQCGYSFDLAGNLKQHFLIHSGEKPQKCPQCDHASSYAAQLRDHIRTNYFQKPNESKWCDYSSITKSDLTKHVLTTVERSHITALCYYSVSQITNLKRHLRGHTGDKPYKCPQCSFSSTRFNNLKQHMTEQHITKSSDAVVQPLF